MKEKLIFIGNNGRKSMTVLYPKIIEGVKLVQRKTLKNGQIRLKDYDKTVILHNRLPEESFNFNNKVVIRWGTRIQVPTDDNSVIYNDNSSAKKASNKKIAREIFIENNLLCPKLLTPQSDNLTYPIIARPHEHTKAENFVVLTDNNSFVKHFRENSDGWYYSEFIDKDREFRFHCAHGKILAIMEKPKGEGIAWNRVLSEDPFVRIKQNEYPYEASLLALKAMKAIGLDFGGVDIMLKGEVPYVIEINTSPSIDSCKYVNDRYSSYFNWLLSSDTKREHWNFEQFKKAKSLSWKEEQFKQ